MSLPWGFQGLQMKAKKKIYHGDTEAHRERKYNVAFISSTEIPWPK
jgi:hypothetical protein